MSDNVIDIANQPSAEELWAGIGGHFDNLGQIVNEFVDNSISSFIANELATRNVIIRIKELAPNGDVEITIEDSGTGIKDLDAAFTLGCQKAGESPLNEHGFGLKHALASANPDNNSWRIFTRTNEDHKNKTFKKIEAPYTINDFKGSVVADDNWPGSISGSGTLIQFVCSREMFKTLGRGIRGGVTSFTTLCDILCEDLGFVYAGIISSSGVSISMQIEEYGGSPITRSVGAVSPDWEDYLPPHSGTETKDLGGGPVEIEYEFGKIREKKGRTPFDNSTTRKYYQRNMSTSGVEIRINGRVLCYNLFKEIWGIEKHNSFNYLLVTINLKSSDQEALPKTRTSKNGLREGDPKLESLYEWIRSCMHEPKKDVSLSDHETDLFEELKRRLSKYNPDPNKVIETEMHVFTQTGNSKDRVRLDLYQKDSYGITVYEGKKENTTSKDVYQLRMYWDGLVYDGITPTSGILVAKEHPDSVKSLIAVVNTMTDTNGNNYHLETKTWEELGLDV